MTRRKFLPPTLRHAFVRAASSIPIARWVLLLAVLGCSSTLLPAARAGLLSTTVLGPAGSPYTYDLTVEFPSGNYYNFILRSAATSLTGYQLFTQLDALTTYLTVDQTFSSGVGGYYVNGVTVGGETSSGYDAASGSFWNYWNGTAGNPTQWTFADNGESVRTLTPGQADGWVYSPYQDHAPQASAFTVPEPGTWTWVGLTAAGGLTILRARRGNRTILSRV